MDSSSIRFSAFSVLRSHCFDDGAVSPQYHPCSSQTPIISSKSLTVPRRGHVFCLFQCHVLINRNVRQSLEHVPPHEVSVSHHLGTNTITLRNKLREI